VLDGAARARAPTMEASAVDVSDAALTAAAPHSLHDRRVSWPQGSLVRSEVAGHADVEGVTVADLWFTAEEIELAKREARLERLTGAALGNEDHVSALSLKRGPRRFPASRRRPRLSAECMLEGAMPPTVHAQVPPSGLCLVRGLAGASTAGAAPSHATAASPAACCAHGAEAPQPATLAPSLAPFAAAPTVRTQHSAPCLQRATNVCFSRAPAGVASLPHRPRAASALQAAASGAQTAAGRPPSFQSSAGGAEQPRRAGCNPNGLSMSQRVAALQLATTGRPTVF